MYCTVIDKAFAPVRDIGTAVDLLRTFRNLSCRQSIQICTDKQSGHIHTLFLHLCQSTRKEFDEFRCNPPLRMNEPKYSGSALWARSLLLTLSQSWDLLFSVSNEKMPIPSDIKEQYEQLIEALHSYQLLQFRDWLDNVSSILEPDVLQVKLDKVCILSTL